MRSKDKRNREYKGYLNEETILCLLDEIHEGHEPLADLGDAPDSSNNFGAAMTAYPSGVQANFPTVYLTGSPPPYGPIHLTPMAVAYLGQGVTREQEADIGGDQDPTNNIIPPTNQSDLDFADDGVLNIPLALPHCTLIDFDYLVNVISIPGDPNMYVNVWFDWSRDGDFNDTQTCGGPTAPEWAVQDQLITLSTLGLSTFTTPKFRLWHPVNSTNTIDPIWMRITLSESPWASTGAGGSGPVGGHQNGETEDYIFVPRTGCSPDLHPDKVINFSDVSVLVRKWLQTVP